MVNVRHVLRERFRLMLSPITGLIDILMLLPRVHDIDDKQEPRRGKGGGLSFEDSRLELLDGNGHSRILSPPFC